MASEKFKILVVDDDLGMLKILEKRLQDQNYDVVCAATGKEALKVVGEHQFDLILLDIMIIDITGVDLARQFNVLENVKKVPIIFISVILNKKEDKKTTEVDVDGRLYLAFAKPLHFPKLLSVIKKTINKSKIGVKTGSRAKFAHGRKSEETQD